MGANPGLDLRSPRTEGMYSQREKDLGKYFYTSSFANGYSNYWIGFNLYAGLAGTTDNLWRLSWKKSNNVSKSGPPMIAGSSKDVIATDFVQTLRGYGWASSHDQETASAGQWVHPNYDKTIDPATNKARGIPFPDKDPGMNLAYSDGHVETHKKSMSYIQAGNSGWFWFW